MTDPSSLPDTPPNGVGLFDLDGTLIAWDCQLLFRHHIVRREPWRVIFLPLFLLFVPLAGMLGAATMKRIFLSYLWGMDPDELAKHAREFGSQVAAAAYPELVECISRHRQHGDFLILASASPDWYVEEIGKVLGFDLCLGTPVDLGALFPDLENHKGEAKVERLRRLLPESWFDGERLRECHGYTDSCADLPMLGICTAATVVNPSDRLLEEAEMSGWQVIRPQRPWSGRVGFAWRVLALLLGLGRDPAGLDAPLDRSSR